MARVAERLITVPLIAGAQVRILQEQIIVSLNAPDSLPSDCFRGPVSMKRPLGPAYPSPARVGSMTCGGSPARRRRQSGPGA